MLILSWACVQDEYASVLLQATATCDRLDHTGMFQQAELHDFYLGAGTYKDPDILSSDRPLALDR
jgi:hypothetical protein